MTDRTIFVFGSNLQGRHGKGAALVAKREWGAINGQGKGLQGDSYAIPTKRTPYETLPLEEIKASIHEFIAFARMRGDLSFLVTPVGCGYAGYKRLQIRPFFRDMPPNCRFTDSWNDPDD